MNLHTRSRVLTCSYNQYTIGQSSTVPDTTLEDKLAKVRACLFLLR